MKLTDKTAAKIIIDGHNIESLTHWTEVQEISWILYSIGEYENKNTNSGIFFWKASYETHGKWSSSRHVAITIDINCLQETLSIISRCWKLESR